LYAGSELKRIQEKVRGSLELTEVKEDSQMMDSTHKVLEQLSGFNISRLTEQEVLKILKLQKLAREYDQDAHND